MLLSFLTKLNRGNLKCSIHCDSDETQDHILENCDPIRKRVGYPHMVNLKLIYGSIDEQYSIIKILTRINNERILMKQNILPGVILFLINFWHLTHFFMRTQHSAHTMLCPHGRNVTHTTSSEQTRHSVGGWLVGLVDWGGALPVGRNVEIVVMGLPNAGI